MKSQVRVQEEKKWKKWRMKITIKPCHYLMMALKFTHLQHVLSFEMLFCWLEFNLPSSANVAFYMHFSIFLLSEHRIGNIFMIASTSITRLILNERFVFSGFAFNLKSDVDFNAVHLAKAQPWIIILWFCFLSSSFPFRFIQENYLKCCRRKKNAT